MLFSKNRVPVPSSPKAGMRDLGGEQAKGIVEADAVF
jgi:hypothetical protein